MAHSYTNKGYNKTIINKRDSYFINIVILSALILIIFCIMVIATQWQKPMDQHFTIDLSPLALPHYAILSTGRMAIGYIISLVFSIIYARIAITSKKAEGIMIPILDVLQSIPILSFMPGIVLALVVLFPNSNIGLELAAIILIFTSQAWNITFGFYQTLLTIPNDLKEVSKISHLNFWQILTRLEIPAGVISLIWNSMMSWSGGWFFLIASEQFTLGNKSFQLPGLGSYLQSAANKGDIFALILGLLTLIAVIILLDQLLWRPLVAWGDKFKIEQDESDEKPNSWFLDLLTKSQIISLIRNKILFPTINKLDKILSSIRKDKKIINPNYSPAQKKLFAQIPIIFLFCLIILGITETIITISQLKTFEWKMIFTGAIATLLRTLIALLISILWTVPLGVKIGLNPRCAKRVQPIAQMAAAIPAAALFPALLLIILAIPKGLSIAAILLMLLGTQWYLLFNVIAGTMSIPNDLREATEIYHITGWRKWKVLILPGIFPYLVTGMITATGGAWNASIVSEYVTFNGQIHKTVGLGATIATAANSNNLHLLLASTLTMAILVFCINRFGWQKIYHLAENKFHFE